MNIIPTQSRPLGYQQENYSSLVTDVAEAQKMLPGYSQGTVSQLLLLDRGTSGANMTALGLSNVVKNSKIYELSHEGLIESNRALPMDLEHKASHPFHMEVPPFIEIEADWDSDSAISGEGNNILGDNGSLFLKQRTIEIPTALATEASLAYYGAVLIQKGEVFSFPGEIYPIFRLNVGSRYLEDFVMTQEGGGLYLEYHHDQPHFHMPLKGEGYYILAKWNDDKTKLRITAFQIPDGQAVYTKKGAIHCDAALMGDLIVGYTTSEDCSTVLLRVSQDDPTMVGAHFV